MKKTVMLTIAILLISVAGFLGYSGLFHTVRIIEKEIGPFTLIYEPVRGDYAKAGAAIERIEKSVSEEFGIKSTRGFGLYYDDPKSVAKENLRSDIGIIADNAESIDLQEIKKRYSVRVYPKTLSMTIELPYKNILSIFIGIWKAYPAFTEYMKKMGYAGAPGLEIYDVGTGTILYSFPVIKK